MMIADGSSYARAHAAHQNWQCSVLHIGIEQPLAKVVAITVDGVQASEIDDLRRLLGLAWESRITSNMRGSHTLILDLSSVEIGFPELFDLLDDVEAFARAGAGAEWMVVVDPSTEFAHAVMGCPVRRLPVAFSRAEALLAVRGPGRRTRVGVR